MNANWFFQAGVEIIDEDRQRGDMVHVGMSDDYIAYLLSLFVRKSDSDASCINRDAIIDHETGEVLLGRGVALAIDVAG